MRTTHSNEMLEIGKTVYDDIRSRLEAAGKLQVDIYGVIDMHGIWLTAAQEPVDPTFPDALNDSEVRIWINACNHEPARQALRQLLAYRIRGVSAPLLSTTVAGDVARIRQRVADGKLDLRYVGALLDGKWDQDLPSRILDAALTAASASQPLEAGKR